MADIPTWIDKRLEGNSDTDKLDQEILTIFLNTDSPYLSRSKLRSKLLQEDVDISEDAVNRRLNKLRDLDILGEEVVGDTSIYWILNEKSEWPVPSDVTVEPVSAEMPVSEFFDQKHVEIGGVGIFVTLLGTLFILVGVIGDSTNLSLVLDYSIPFIAMGFLIILIGYLLVFLACFLLVKNIAFSENT